MEKISKLTMDETDALVSIVNTIIERAGYPVSEFGLGYLDDGTIISADGSELQNTLDWVLDDLMKNNS